MDPPAVAEEDDPSHLAREIESRLRESLARAGQEYPPGCQADWLAGVVAGRMLAEYGADSTPPPTPNSLVKLCVFLLENLADVSNSYEEFYSGQMAALRDENASAHAQVAAIEDENGRLREQLHRRAEELRTAHATVESLKARNLAAAAAPARKDQRFDEAVAVDDSEDEDDVEGEEESGEQGECGGGGKEAAVNGESECRHCARYREAADRAEAEAAHRIAEAAAASAALKADIADWEADMAEKVHQNVELAAQLEACQRMLSRASKAASSGSSGSPTAPRSIFSGMLVRRK